MVDGRIDIVGHGEIIGPLNIIKDDPFNHIIRPDGEVTHFNITGSG